MAILLHYHISLCILYFKSALKRLMVVKNGNEEALLSQCHSFTVIAVRYRRIIALYAPSLHLDLLFSLFFLQRMPDATGVRLNDIIVVRSGISSWAVPHDFWPQFVYS